MTLKLHNLKPAKGAKTAKTRVGRGEGAPGDTSVDVVITATTDQVLHGYSLALSFPADVLVLQEISTVGTHVSGLNPEFEAPKTNNQLGIATLAVIIDFNDPVEEILDPSIAPGNYQFQKREKLRQT